MSLLDGMTPVVWGGRCFYSAAEIRRAEEARAAKLGRAVNKSDGGYESSKELPSDLREEMCPLPELSRAGKDALAREMLNKLKLAVNDNRVLSGKLWLWKNFVNGVPEYWAFDNAFPVYTDGDDPQTLGEPCGYAIFKESRPGRKDISDEDVMARVMVSPQPPVAEPIVNDVLSPEDAELLRLAIDNFNEDGETSVDYEDLMRFANMGLLECSYFNVTDAAEIAIERAEAAKKGTT